MLGDKIKLYRENKKMTQNDLASILEVSAGTISSLIFCKLTSFNMICIICKCYLSIMI